MKKSTRFWLLRLRVKAVSRLVAVCSLLDPNPGGSHRPRQIPDKTLTSLLLFLLLFFFFFMFSEKVIYFVSKCHTTDRSPELIHQAKLK